MSRIKWSASEIKYLKDNYSNMTADEIQENINRIYNTDRTVSAVKVKIKKLGLSKQAWYSEEEIKFLEDNCNLSRKELYSLYCKTFPNTKRSFDSLSYKRITLGLHSSVYIRERVKYNTCVICGKKFPVLLKTKDKKCCSTKCRGILKHNEHKEHYERVGKRCRHCGKPIPYERHWVRNNYCSTECWYETLRQKTQKKYKIDDNKLKECFKSEHLYLENAIKKHAYEREIPYEWLRDRFFDRNFQIYAYYYQNVGRHGIQNYIKWDTFEYCRQMKIKNKLKSDLIFEFKQKYAGAV